LLSKLISDNNPRYPVLLKSMATEYKKLKNMSKADEYYRKSIDAYKIVFSNKNTKTINTMIEYLEFLEANGKQSQVNELITEIEKIIIVEKIDDVEINNKISEFRSTLK